MIGSEMQTEYEFRVNGKYANRLFGPNDGKDIGSVRVIRIGPEDPRFAKIGEFDRLIDRETDGHTFLRDGKFAVAIPRRRLPPQPAFA
jgi:hypothetical protein